MTAFELIVDIHAAIDCFHHKPNKVSAFSFKASGFLLCVANVFAIGGVVHQTPIACKALTPPPTSVAARFLAELAICSAICACCICCCCSARC